MKVYAKPGVSDSYRYCPFNVTHRCTLREHRRRRGLHVGQKEGNHYSPALPISFDGSGEDDHETLTCKDRREYETRHQPSHKIGENVCGRTLYKDNISRVLGGPMRELVAHRDHLHCHGQI
jgi:hypothetical protein